MSSEPLCLAVVVDAVSASLDVGIQIRAMMVSAIGIDHQEYDFAYLSTAPSLKSSALWPWNFFEHSRSRPQFCLKIPKLAASPDLLSPAKHERSQRDIPQMSLRAGRLTVGVVGLHCIGLKHCDGDVESAASGLQDLLFARPEA